VSDPTLDPTGWRRLHPLSPLIRGWKIIVVAAGVLLQQGGENLAHGGLRSGTARSILLGGFGVVVVASLGYSLLAWRMSSYTLDSEALHLRTGVLSRHQRQARLDRLQAVDVVQPLLARFIGLAELRIEVAGGKGSAVRLTCLRESEAQDLRRVLLARAAGLHLEEGQAAPEAPERGVLTVSVPVLIESLVRSGTTLFLLAAVVALVIISVVVHSPAPVFGVIAPLAAGVSYVWTRFNGGFNFRVATSPDGLRLHHGLLQTTAQTGPPGRVQALELIQPLLWRGRDWWRVQVNVAGYAGEGREGRGEDLDAVVLPVGTRGEAITLLSLVLPDLGLEEGEGALAVLDAGLTGTGAAGGFTASPRSARWLDPLAWRRHGFRVTGRALLARSGRFVRRLAVVPHERTQSLGLEQGPLQARLGLASFVLHSTPGPVHARVDHLAGDVAARLLDDQAARAHEARAAAGDDRWMLPTRPVPTAEPQSP
jgi:putative membrane protein